MNIKRNINIILIAVLSALCTSSVRGQGAYYFLDPNGWFVGDFNSTYQEWDVLMESTDNKPDFGYLTNPNGLPEPNLSVIAPGFVSSSANFYSYEGDYAIEALIFNHGGSYGTGAPVGYGSHVIVQTAATINSDYDVSVYHNSLQIVGPNDETISGGSNSEVLQAKETWRGIVSSSWGQVTQQELIWEFFLPNYTRDFRIKADVAIHSMFTQMRVDSIITQESYPLTPVLGPYDLNGDGIVNFQDYAVFSTDWQDNCDQCAADFNNDGWVDVLDLQDFLKHWLEGSFAP